MHIYYTCNLYVISHYIKKNINDNFTEDNARLLYEICVKDGICSAESRDCIYIDQYDINENCVYLADRFCK